MDKEPEQKELRKRGESASTLRRKIVEVVSSVELSFARRCNQRAKSSQDFKGKPIHGCSHAGNPQSNHDTSRDKVISKLTGTPTDFKDTFLHSRFDVLQDLANQTSCAVGDCSEQEEFDAWRAADEHRERSRYERSRQIELGRLYQERKLESGSAAAAKLLSDQRIAMMEKEVEEAFRMADYVKDRYHAVTKPGTFKRARLSGQERRALYTKHKTSNYLSCPGLVVTGSPQHQQERIATTETTTSIITIKPKGLEGTTFGCSEKQDLAKSDTRGESTQVLDQVSYPFQDGASMAQETRPHVSGRSAHSRRPTDSGDIRSSAQQLNGANGTDPISPGSGVTESTHPSLVEIHRKRILNVRGPFELAELNTASGEGSGVQQHHVLSLSKCSTLEQNADSGMKTAMPPCHVSDEAGVARRWSARKKGRVNENCNNDSPSRICHHPLLNEEVAEVEKEKELNDQGVALRYRRSRKHSSMVDDFQHLDRNGSFERHDSPIVPRPPFISSGTLGYKKSFTGPMIQPRPCKLTVRGSESKGAIDEEKNLHVQNVGKDFKAQLPCVRRGSELDSEQKTMKKSAQGFYPREGDRQLSDGSSSDMSRIDSNIVRTIRSLGFTSRPQTRPLNPQEQRKTLKQFDRLEKLVAHEDQTNEDSKLLNESASKIVGGDSGCSTNRREDSRYKTAKNSGVADNLMLSVVGKRREENSKKGEGFELQKKHDQKATPSVRAVWKSYVVEKKQHDQATRKKLEAPAGRPSIKSKSCSPPASTESESNSRANKHRELQDNHQFEDRLEQPISLQTPRHCCTSAVRAKNVPNPRARAGRDNSLPRSWKLSQLDSNGDEVDELDKGGMKTSFQGTKRFQSPVNQVHQVFRSTRGNTEETIFKEKNCLTHGFSARKEKLRRSEESKSCFDEATLRPNNKLEEKDGIIRKDSEFKSSNYVADTPMTAWKTQTFSRDQFKVMKRANELIKTLNSSGMFKVNSGRKFIRPWVSCSPSRRSPDRNKGDNFLDDNVRKQRIDVANSWASRESSMICSAKKPYISRSPSRSPDYLVADEEDYHNPSYRNSFSNLKTSKNCPLADSKHATQLSKRMNLSNKSPCSSERGELSLLSSNSENKGSDNDTWGRQSLDYVLGSLAEQVRELDERLRGTSISSPASSSSSSITSRELYLNGDNQSNNQLGMRLVDELAEDRSGPFSSVASSPKRKSLKSNRGSPDGNALRLNANGNTRDQKDDSSFRNSERLASAGTHMDELKKLLREISSESNQSLLQNLDLAAASSMITQTEEGENELNNVQDIVNTHPGSRDSMYKTEVYLPNTNAEFESRNRVTSTSISTENTRIYSAVSNGIVTRKPKMMLVGKGSGTGHTVNKAGSDELLNYEAECNRCPENGHSWVRVEMERVAEPILDIGLKMRDRRENTEHEKRNLPQGNGFSKHDEVIQVLDKRLIRKKWAQQQAFDNVRQEKQESFQETPEIMDHAPNQVLNDGHLEHRKQLFKEAVGNRSCSPEINGHGCVHEIENKTPVRQKTDIQQVHFDEELHSIEIEHKEANLPFMHREVVEIGKPAVSKISGKVRPGGTRSNGHTIRMESSMQRRPVHQEKGQPRYSEHLNEGESMRNRRPGSSHCCKSWTNGNLDLDAVEDKGLNSQSADFSTGNIKRLLWIENPHLAVKNRNGSKSYSLSGEDTPSNRSLIRRNQRSETLPKLRKAFAQRPVLEDAVSNGKNSSQTNSGLVQGGVSAPNLDTLKSHGLGNLRKSNPVGRRVSAPRSSDDHPDAAQDGSFSPRIRSCPGGNSLPGRDKRRTSSIPKSRQVTEKWSSQAETSEPTSKTTQDNNYLPVIMAKDPESRLKVIERRKKALQLDLEHRQRMRNSRPTSSRSSP